jgi:hypothetical protein
MDQQIISKVWQLSGLMGSVRAGLLVYDNGQVIYINDEGSQFSVPLAELKNIKWPFLRMGMGFDTVVNDKKYQFSFSKPNPSAPELDDTTADTYLRPLGVGKFWDAIGTLRNIKADKATTKQWKEILKG